VKAPATPYQRLRDAFVEALYEVCWNCCVYDNPSGYTKRVCLRQRGKCRYRHYHKLEHGQAGSELLAAALLDLTHAQCDTCDHFRPAGIRLECAQPGVKCFVKRWQSIVNDCYGAGGFPANPQKETR